VDRLPADAKSRLDSALEGAKQALRAGDPATIRTGLDELNSAYSAAGASLYQSAQGQGQPALRGRRRAAGSAHRSISPMTMSMLALMAMTSESKWPSTILGIAERFTKDGGRIRQRTGLDVPSDTI